MKTTEIKSIFPLLTEIELQEELTDIGLEKEYQQGANIFRKGQFIKYLPLVMSGAIKVMREDEEGNEVLLYYLESGHTCAMSITCCMQHKKSEIWAIAEDKTRVLFIPVERAGLWMKKYNSWRNFIINSYAIRMQELLHTLDSIAFFSLDARLLKYLKDRAATLQQNQFTITHSDIAKELNASREAISRLLKKLETLGKVELGRNKIKLLDHE